MEIYNRATFNTKFNQVRHEFEIYLDSSAGESDNPGYKYPINPNAIVNLTIEDTLADWIVRGHLTFFYNPESGTGSINPVTGNNKDATTGVNVPETQPFFYFRNDGFDLLRIRIKPLLENNSNIPNQINISNPTHWTLSYLFSVYNIEDIDLPPGAQNQTSSYIKCLKIYFWDSWFQKMNTNLIEYSTAQSPKANIESDIQEGKYSNPGTISTGQAMKEIINLGLGQNSTQEGYTDTTFIDPILKFNYEPVKNEDWEDGAAKIFYTAPAQATAFDNLMYIYDKHISNEAYSVSPTQSAPRGGTPDTKLHDFSILVKDRGPSETDIGQFTLKPITSYFNNAGSGLNSPGPYQYEHFFLQAYTDINKPTKTPRAPMSKANSDTIDFKALKYNTISNYRFVDISALTNSKQFVTSPVYSFDFKNRTFNVEFKNNSILTARKFMSEKYIKSLYKNSRDELEKLFLINLNKDKNDKDILPQFSLHGDDPTIRQHAGLQRLLYIGLFQNAAINFRTLGLSFREPGRFIGIDRTDGVEEGDFEDKFYGQWFIIDVKHIFETEIYYNDITAIKIHRFQTPNINFLGTL